jgi:hypothetical protein
MIGVDDEAAVAKFLSLHGFGADFSFLPLAGGGRHAVLKVVDGSRVAVLKRHGKHPHAAERDSFERELACHEFIAEHAPDACPSIIGSDAASRSLLFAWADGVKIGSGDVDEAAVRRMADFLKLINAPAARLAAESRALPSASEAGFTLQDHLLNARRRIARLLEIPDRSAVAADMKSFVAATLIPYADRWEASLSTGDLVQQATPVFSPSDFGFHNVIQGEDGRFVFIDFEHAGWDDAAKLCADFLIQPECILSQSLRRRFLDEMAEGDAIAEDLAERTQRLLPLQAVKWALIILNPFADQAPDAQLLPARLQKACEYFERVVANR